MTLTVSAPNEVTDSKHAKLIRGINQLLWNRNVWISATEQGGGISQEQDPFIMASQYLCILQANVGEGTKSYLICEALSKFPKSCFERWGDPNCIKDVSRAWFAEHGVQIDVQAEVITSTYGVEISIQDIIDHVMTYKPGEYKKPLQDELERLLGDFRELFDFNLTPGYARFLANLKLKSDLPF